MALVDMTDQELAQLRADISAWVDSDSTTDEDDLMMRRIREAGGVERIGELSFSVQMRLTAKSVQALARNRSKLRRAMERAKRRERAQERLERLIRVILLFSRMRVALLKWYDDTCKKRYAPGQAGAIDAAEEFAGAARGQKRPRDEAGPSQ